MSRHPTERKPTFRLGVALWLAGMAGVLTTLLIPLTPPEDAELSVWMVRGLGLLQNSVVLALAVWAGVKLAPKVNLHAPTFEALAQRRDLSTALRPQVAPGITGGVLGGVGLVAVSFFTPDALAGMEEIFDPPLVMRLLYGGITEELLVRWGLMTFFLWGAWRLVGRDTEAPTAGLAWCSIVLSALAFGALHLPVAFAVAEEVTSGLLVYIVGANSAFGVLFGYLFWKCGLEASMIAHALAHLILFLTALTPMIS